MLNLEQHTPGHVSKSIKCKRVVWNIGKSPLARMAVPI